MSGTSAIGGFVDFPGGVAASTVANAASVARRLATLTQQVGDGYVSGHYAGLGTGMQTALVTAPAIARQQAWQANIAAASGAMDVAQTALSQISSEASTFYADTNNLNGLNPSQVDSVAAAARDALVRVAGLLNSTDAGRYVFAGQDSGNPPLSGSDAILSSGFFTQIQTAVAALPASGAAGTIAATLSVAASNAAGTSPFSAALSQPAATLAARRPILAGPDGAPVPVGITASANADVASTGPSTTGSYMRDVLRALATLGSLSSAQAGTAGFDQLVADTRTSLGGAITALNADAGVLGDRQARLQADAQTSVQTVTALQAQLSGAQDVDMAATLSRLTQTQTQLQASYQLIAQSQSLSLVKYLAAGG
jgi:flagellar hook-associated protein 3 FlgL